MWYKSIVRPLLFRLDPETAHDLTFSLAERLGGHSTTRALVRRSAGLPDPRLNTTVLGHPFPSPIGTAAGFDKNGRLIRILPELGFGFMEVGSATAQASAGNARPRMFRLPQDQALINRMGLNNHGAAALAEKLRTSPSSPIPLGVNVAKTHDPKIQGDAALRDYATSVSLLAPHAAYIALNVSCPNTEEGKTFEEPQALRDLLDAVRSDAPILVKFSSDIQERELIPLLDICEEHGVSGYVAVNTSTDRSSLITPVHTLESIGRGGLSGRPLASDAMRVLRAIRAHVPKEKCILSVGGISTAKDVMVRLEAGADLVQIYTAMVYEGPLLVSRLNRELSHWLDREGTTLETYLRAAR